MKGVSFVPEKDSADVVGDEINCPSCEGGMKRCATAAIARANYSEDGQTIEVEKVDRFLVYRCAGCGYQQHIDEIISGDRKSIGSNGQD